MSKTKDTIIGEQNAKQPDFVKELLERGTTTLTAKTSDELTEMVNDIPSDVEYGAGAVGQNHETGVFVLQLHLTPNK